MFKPDVNMNNFGGEEIAPPTLSQVLIEGAAIFGAGVFILCAVLGAYVICASFVRVVS